MVPGKQLLLHLLIAMAVGGFARAEVIVAPFFGDGMVLQRNRPVKVWGQAAPDEAVVVRFGDREARAVTDREGRWLVELPLFVASKIGAELVVRGTNSITIHDVLVGDVWICAGQSNMEFPVKDARDGQNEVANANEPSVREVKISRRLSETPLEDFKCTSWRAATSQVTGDFTAVGYFFAREMVRATGIPVGIINCTWSGTSVEPWMSAAALNEKPEFAVVGERWRADLAAYPERRKVYEQTLTAWKEQENRARALGEDKHGKFLREHREPRPPSGAPDHPYPGNPTQIYNGMVFPLRHASIRGVLWYQGEANAVRAPEYGLLFQASVRCWRTTFGQPEMPFYFAQIANFAVDTDWARLREEQTKALALPTTGMVVTIDIGDPANIHPQEKQEVGRRFSLIALAKLEHQPIEYSGPLFERVSFSGGEAQIHFTHADGLLARGGKPSGLELAGEDRVFHPAEGHLESDGLHVSCRAVPLPVAVRYAWASSPAANLYNGAGLPASPFRTDAW